MTWQWVTSANSYHWSRVTCSDRSCPARAQKMSPSTKPEIDWKVVGRPYVKFDDVSQAEFAYELGVSQVTAL